MAVSKKDVAKQQVKEDREKVREMYLSGKTVKEIAKETYFSSSYCYAMVRDLAKEKNFAKKAKRAPLDEAMIQDAKAGMTVAEIAKKHGVTYQQCYYTVSEYAQATIKKNKKKQSAATKVRNAAMLEDAKAGIVPEKDARFKENELRKLNLLKPELIQLPANLENLLIAEDATNFPESRFLLREEEETVINKLLATRKAALAIKELGIHYTCSLLLTGLPGVGKTELARYIAHKANLPFVFLKFSGLVNSALGRTQQNIGRVFDYAKRTPCVLCVDEIDAIGMCRGSRDDVAEMSLVTIALMQELDRLPNDVILIGTTNRVDNLDEALIRRFTFKHRIKPLGDDDMKELCKKFLASADYPFTESELDELFHSLREQRTASAVVNACTERIVAHIVSQLPENSADAV